jgi:CRISPR-associated protein Csb2
VLTLRLTFPWGRYYAHPWGQNPSRIAEAEWPPSPWRLLRAIAAAWFQANPGSEASPELVQTLETLARELPTFVLPKVAFSRAIHYQPNYGATSKDDLALAKYKRVRHENHFVAVAGDVLLHWHLNGVSEEAAHRARSLIKDLAERISYFGRAESVCELQVEDAVNHDAGIAQVAVQEGKPCRRIDPICRDVFCPDPTDFHASDLWRRRDDSAAHGTARKHLVQDLIETPQPMPDGAAWYSYRMPDGWPDRWVVRHARPPRRRRDPDRVIAHFLEFSLQCRISVPTKHVVSIANLFRADAIRNHAEPSFALSGRDPPDGLDANHHHAFYLPVPDVSGNSLELLRVWCLHGFTQREVNALLSVGPLRWAGRRFPVRPVLLRMSPDRPALECSARWQSLTPFVPPLFWHRKKAGPIRAGQTPESQIVRCLRKNQGPYECGVTRLSRAGKVDWEVCKVHLPPATPNSRAEPESRVGLRFQLDFPRAVALPFPAFGHSCHFGLGQFVPVPAKGEK